MRSHRIPLIKMTQLSQLVRFVTLAQRFHPSVTAVATCAVRPVLIHATIMPPGTGWRGHGLASKVAGRDKPAGRRLTRCPHRWYKCRLAVGASASSEVRSFVHW
jgi:hypothetical protein